MRSADVASLLRIPLMFISAYAIIARYNPLAVVLLLVVLFVSDAADGYLSFSGRHTTTGFISYLLEEGHLIARKKRTRGPTPGYAPNLDLAIDRITDYGLWITYTYLAVLPIFVVVVVFIRNTLADLLLLRRGKSYSKLKSAFGRIASSHLIRGVNAALKAINFVYLSLIYVAGFPILPGYALTAAVLLLILLRGAAEIYEGLI